MDAVTDTTDTARTQDHYRLQKYQQMRRLILALLIFVIGFGLLFVGSAWGDSIGHEMIELIGLGLITFGILGRMWSTLYIGGKKAQMVVSDGPYSIMRNPLYFFSAIAATGAGAQTGTISFALFFGLITVIAFHVVIYREEGFLSEHFGEVYAKYCSKVPRFFPKPSLFNEPDVLEISTGRLYSTFLDGLVFFVSLPLLELVEVGQETGMIPVLFHFY